MQPITTVGVDDCIRMVTQILKNPDVEWDVHLKLFHALVHIFPTYLYSLYKFNFTNFTYSLSDFIKFRYLQY